MKYWLLKTEGDIYPIDQLEKDKKTPWSGVRNFRARNFMRDDMSVGDLCLFYHSSCKVTGVYGIAKVASRAYPDPTQFDKKSDYFDERSNEENPLWMLVDISFVQKLKRPVTATEMKKDPILKNMTLWRIPRLSIHSVEEKDYKHIVGLADKGSLF
jgi:predicted RNA-binding protein with PUA-like domain